MKKALRETQTLRALAVVRFGHRPPARCHKPTDRTDYNTLRRSVNIERNSRLKTKICDNDDSQWLPVMGTGRNRE